MKEEILIIIGIIGSCISCAFGGWDNAMTTLIIFMAIDYLTGLIVAGVFNKSVKTETGGLNSKVGWKGLCRKGGTLAVVLIACRIDILMSTSFVRDAVVIAYVINEFLSIAENMGLMGVPVPQPLIKAIDILKQQNEKGVDSNENIEKE